MNLPVNPSQLLRENKPRPQRFSSSGVAHIQRLQPSDGLLSRTEVSSGSSVCIDCADCCWSIGRRFLIATTGIISGRSVVERTAGISPGGGRDASI